ANSNSQNDTINLAANGTYTLTTVDNSTYGSNGLPVILDDGNHMLTINGNGATIQRDTSGGTPDFRVLCVAVSDVHITTVVINDLVIAHGSATGTDGLSGYGGGILIAGSDTRVTLN